MNLCVCVCVCVYSVSCIRCVSDGWLVLWPAFCNTMEALYNFAFLPCAFTSFVQRKVALSSMCSASLLLLPGYIYLI